MSRQEREEIKDLPEKYKPMGAWGYWAWSIIYGFPIVGLIFIIVNSLRSCNIARRNHARSFLCTYVLIILFVGITFLILYFTGVFQMMLDFIDKMVKIK